MNRSLASALFFCAFTTMAWAQTTETVAPAQAATGASPPAAAAVSPPGRLPPLPPEETIPMAMAMKAAQAVLDACAPYGEPAVAEIMDMYGNPKVVLAADGALGNSPEAARKKAYTAMKKGMSTAEFARTLDHKPARGEVIQGDPNLNANDGGFPIRRDGKIIGALGASSPAGKHTSGATYDEYCGEAGLAEIHF